MTTGSSAAAGARIGVAICPVGAVEDTDVVVAVRAPGSPLTMRRGLVNTDSEAISL